MQPSLFSETGDSLQDVFTTDYDQVIDRLQHIDPLRYAKTRNFLTGAVTRLSPYISRGVISLLQVKEALLQKGYRPYQMEKFLQELAWREYYQRVWQAKGSLIWEDLKQPQPDTQHNRMPAALQNAATGITAIDTAIQNLYATGYMHNHIRMYTAAVACNIGKAHWRQPSRWLYYHLLDGDIASNNCSWQWVAGAFASKKYYCNQENINKYTNSHQSDSFLNCSYETIPDLPVPEVLKAVHDLPLQTILPETGLPVIDTTKPTLLYNSYNLDPAWRKNEDVNRVLLLEPSHFAAYPVSEKVLSFIMALSKNIKNIQLYCGEAAALQTLYKEAAPGSSTAFIAKEHPAFLHYPGSKDSPDWMYPKVTGYHPSFFSFWKQCERHL
jgi:deoxyribodipyrimidine photo-lyase